MERRSRWTGDGSANVCSKQPQCLPTRHGALQKPVDGQSPSRETRLPRPRTLRENAPGSRTRKGMARPHMIQRLQCPLTGQAAPVVFSRPYDLPEFRSMTRGAEKRWLAGKPYEIRESPLGGFHFQTWVMEDGELADWYSPPTGDEVFREQIERQKLHWFAHMTEEILVLRQLCPAPSPRVLDFGCNWGKWASMALAHGCDVYAVEVNRAAADFCSRRGIKIVTQEDLAGLEFDFINVDQVAEHLSDPLGVVGRLAGRLKPGAYLKLSTPDQSGLPARLKRAQASGDNGILEARTLDALAPLEHVNLFSGSSLRKLGQLCGLTPVRLPWLKWMGAGQLWNLPRQFNRNWVTPWKRWRQQGTYAWFQKS